MGDKRMKNSSKGATQSNFSLKCVKSVQKCVSELKRAMQAMQFESGRILKHEISMISSCSANLLAALTSCNLYRIHFSDESYYLTQLQKIEKGVTQIFDFVTSLSCRKYFSSLGNNTSCSDLFSSVEDTFDSFVGPLLHIFNSFNVQWLLFVCDQTHLFILDQLSKKAIKARIEKEKSEKKEYQFDDEEEYDDDNEEEEESETADDENSVKDKWNEISGIYTKQEKEDCLTELAILIDFMAGSDSERYASVFKKFYQHLFHPNVRDKIYNLLKRVTSFKMLNKFAYHLFYNTEVMSMSLEEIEEITELSGNFQLQDLTIKLARSGFVPLSHVPLNSSYPVAPGSVILKEQNSKNNSSISNNTLHCPNLMNYEGGPMPMAESQNVYGISSSSGSPINIQNNSSSHLQIDSGQLKIGQKLKMCPHSLAFCDLCCVGSAQEPSDEQVENCHFLKKQRDHKREEAENNRAMMAARKSKTSAFNKKNAFAEEAQIDDSRIKSTMKGQTEEVEDQLALFNKKEILFGRRAENSMLRPDFYFEPHEQQISRQQFKITYEMHSNEYNVQCLSQSSLTQLLIDSAGFELTPGSIIIIQDQIAFQVVALKCFPQSQKKNESENNEVNASSPTKTSSIQEMAQRLSRQFTQQDSINTKEPISNKQFKKLHSSQKLSYRQTQLLEVTNQLNELAKESKENLTPSSSSDDESDSQEEENQEEESNVSEKDDNELSNPKSIKHQKKKSIKRSSLITRKTGAELLQQQVNGQFGASASPVVESTQYSQSTNFEQDDNGNQNSQNFDQIINDDEVTTDFKKTTQTEKRESQMNLSLAGSFNTTLNSQAISNPQGKMIPPVSARVSQAQIQSHFEPEDNSTKDEAYLHIRVLWSSIDTEKEDYTFQFGPETDRSTIEINFGSDPKSNQINLIDNGSGIKEHAHCSINYQDDVWAIVSNHDSLEYYSGLALKRSDEVENGLISKKILIEKGFNILVQGYIFNCDI